MLMQIQVKLRKTKEIKQLEPNKQQARYRLIYLDVCKYDKTYNCRFEGESRALKVNVKILAVINKERSCAWCI